jgi:hypothetical protein
MHQLHRLEAFYIAMNPWGRQLILELAAGFAIDFPAPKKIALLRLVANGARVQTTPNHANQPVDSFPLVVTGKPVDRE